MALTGDLERQVLEAYAARFPEARGPKVLVGGPGEPVACWCVAVKDPPKCIAFVGDPADWGADPPLPPGDSFASVGADGEEALKNLLLFVQDRTSELTFGGRPWPEEWKFRPERSP